MHEDLSGETVPSAALRTQPFRLLRVDPTATRQQIEDAFESAKKNPRASEEDLAKARDVLADPDRRLPFELSYPLGNPISELDEWQRLLSTDVQSGELLKHAGRLSTLGQANFHGFIAAHRAAEAELLSAMIDALGRIELAAVYDELKDSRRIAEYPAPSLAAVRAVIEAQPAAHCQAAISAYGTIDDAAKAVSGCLAQMLARREPRHVDILTHLLLAYRGPAVAAQIARLQDIEAVCDEIEHKPDGDGLIGALGAAFERWMALCRPLLLVKDPAPALEEASRTLAARLRALVIDLALRQRYETAIEITALGKDRLHLVPYLATSLDEAVVPAAQALRQLKARKLAALSALAGKLANHPAPLIASLREGGFGARGGGAAQDLWQAFIEAVRASNDPELTEPWTEIRTLARRLAGQAGGRSAAVMLLQGLRGQAPQTTAPASVLERLEDDLRQLRAPARKAKARSRTSGRKVPFYVAGALLSAACLALLFFGFEKPRLLLTDTFAKSFPLPSAVAPEQKAGAEDPASKTKVAETKVAPTGAEETPPEVGTGQRLSLDNLRYCRFQEERLRLIKPKVQNAEDTRAFNLLAVDYNSRCSDFLYRDGDAVAVAAELNSNRDRLAKEADQIVAAWLGRTPTQQAVK